MTSVWLEGKKRRGGRGGGQPSGLDRRRITEVTVRLLDAEGLGKFSMRRLAAELNVTAMSVYWYVDTKDDLLELALDAAYGELRLPGTETGIETGTGIETETEDETGTGDDWRDQLRVLAGEYRALLVRHPWLSPLAGRFLNIGPNALSFSRAVQDVVRRTGLPAHRMTSAISAVFQFVYGYGTMEGHYFARAADVGMSPDDYYKHAVESVTGDPDAAHVVEDSKDIMAARGGDTVAEMLGRDFDFALDLLIAGIEATAARG
ncbi:TetR/AcrR family transcriptional regulator [Streptomyces sp. DH24]|uniref:TetR/AcrR family transcriptional regulator n=1 Tax=Streptomyces sp. DH24 TaxID=3040123 RepID=UPI0024414971|nr:TetR/AcrR family transcriptional regulator [Streptomyces sp. DH24]MDG9720615.1 TetR/AcrR family transcriptional regulator [Streptomyces sp. DH24]